MFESLKTFMTDWQARHDDRVKLQHTYIVSAVSLLIVAGVVGLVNRTLGQNILVVAIVGAGIFIANAVVWSLLQSALSSQGSRRPAARRKK